MSNQSLEIPELRIGDIVEVKCGKESKIFELEDIACWEKVHEIKTINMEEKKFYKYHFDTMKAMKEAKQKILKKAKWTLYNDDKIIIKCSHDSTFYTVWVRRDNSYNPEEITFVSFQKVMFQ
jgi:NMD protein affecting ribosome stability and mRNA decay